MKKIALLLLSLPIVAQTPKPIRIVRTIPRDAVIRFIEKNDPAMKNPRYAERFEMLAKDAPYIEYVVQSEPPK